MIKIQESIAQDKRLEDIFYRPHHNKKEFFEQPQETDVEQALEEYLAGTMASFDKDPFEPEVAEKLRMYIRNAPGYPYMLFRYEAKTERNSDLKVNDLINFRISSWTKSYEAVKEMIETDPNGVEDVVLFVSENLTAINVEGYSGFYEQRESLTYGKFKVIKIGSVGINGKRVKYYKVMQVGF